MDENIKATPTVSSSNAEQKQSPAFDPRDEYPDEYFDEYLYDELYYDDICMSCQYWIGGVCNCEHSTCNYEPF